MLLLKNKEQNFISHGEHVICNLQIGDVYRHDPLNLELSLEYWCPVDPVAANESAYSYRPPPRQVSCVAFVNVFFGIPEVTAHLQPFKCQEYLKPGYIFLCAGTA